MLLVAARRVCAAATLLCATLIALGFCGALWFPLDIFAHFRPQLLALTALGALICAALSAWRSAAAGLLAASLAAISLLAHLPVAAPRAPGGRTLSVAFANVDLYSDRHDDAAEALLALDVDVLVTAETPLDWLYSEPLNARYPYVVNRVRWIYNGVWIWSRLPIIEGAKRDPSETAPGLAYARLDLGPDGEVTVLGLHFRRPVTQPQQGQIEGLASAAPQVDGPLIVVGDFNAAPWSFAAQRIRETLDVQASGGLRWTWRGDRLGWLGALQIDQMAASADIAPGPARAFSVPGSDHRGLVRRYQLSPTR